VAAVGLAAATRSAVGRPVEVGAAARGDVPASVGAAVAVTGAGAGAAAGAATGAATGADPPLFMAIIVFTA
jgi:hypothetical protein